MVVVLKASIMVQQVKAISKVLALAKLLKTSLVLGKSLKQFQSTIKCLKTLSAIIGKHLLEDLTLRKNHLLLKSILTTLRRVMNSIKLADLNRILGLISGIRAQVVFGRKIHLLAQLLLVLVQLTRHK